MYKRQAYEPPAEEPQAEVAPEPAYEPPAEEPQIEVAPEPAYEPPAYEPPADEPQAEVAPEPAYEAPAEEPEVEVAPEPATEDEPQDEQITMRPMDAPVSGMDLLMAEDEDDSPRDGESPKGD